MANEKTLIYKEDLLDEVLGHFGIDLAYLGEDLQFCQEAIDMAPAVDAVEVVRCKDCKYFKKGKPFRHECKKVGGGIFYPNPDDFCSYGERKDT